MEKSQNQESAWNNKEVLVPDGVSLESAQGEWVAITGPSGPGKSALMRILGCLDSPTSGEYRLNGVEVSGLDDTHLPSVRNREIGLRKPMGAPPGYKQIHAVPDEAVTLRGDISRVWEARLNAVYCHNMQWGDSPILQAHLENSSSYRVWNISA